MNGWPTTWQERAAMFVCFALVAALWWMVMFPLSLRALVWRALEWVGL